MNPIQLSLLIPFYNEEENIIPLMETLGSIDWGGATEFVFVDDCSQDDSLNLLKRWILHHEPLLSEKGISTQVWAQPVNGGKGTALHKALELSRGLVVIVQDADGEYSPSEIPDLIRPILDNKADVVYGSRFRQNVTQAHRTYHYLINVTLTLLSNLASGLHLTDMETCYKAFRREILANIQLRSKRFGFEPEVTAHLARLRIKVWELPISYYPRSYIEGKKITWKDGIAALWHIIYFNWIIKKEERFLPGIPDKYLLKNWPRSKVESLPE